MKKILTTSLLFTVLFLFGSLKGIAQNTVECSNCPLYLMDNVVNGIIVDEIEVPESDIDDLGIAPLQSVCFDITHDWLSDLFIVLESPAGKKYFLMGDGGNNSGECDASVKNANVCFLVGSDNPLSNGSSYANYCGNDPDVCLTGDWTLGCGNAMVSNMLPDAFAAPNCNLNDFNEPGDPISGKWRAYFGCVCGLGENATLNNWTLNFAIPSSQIPCTTAPVTSAELSYQPCETDELSFKASDGVSYLWTGPNSFQSASGVINIPDFSEDLTGLYSCKIVTENYCYDLHEIEVKDICQKQITKIYRDGTKEICLDELLDAGFVNAYSSEILDIKVEGNCLSISASDYGVDSVFVLERVGAEEVYTRYSIEVVEKSPGKKSFPADWLLSPNPTQGTMTLNTPQVLPQGVKVLNFQGATMKTFEAEGENTFLDIKEFANGVYIVQVKTENGVFVERVILAN